MTLAEIVARTAARKAANLIPDYSHLAGERRQSDRTAPPSPAPCEYLDRELTGAERVALNLDHRRVWRLCLHEDLPLGGAVCACGGCSPRCPGYSAGD